MYILLWNLLLIAGSRLHGVLVAPRTKTPSSVLPTPYILTKNSVFTLLEASFSPSPLCPAMESISSMKIIDGFYLAAISNKALMFFSDSPTYLLIKSEELTEKNVLSH